MADSNDGATPPKAGVSRLLFLIAIAPAALTAALIWRYGVSVPVGDDWALVPLFEKWRNHQLTFADLYHQHNEHRMLVPKLIYLAFAQLTNWNLRAEMFLTVALCAGTSGGIYVLLRRTTRTVGRELILLWAAANLLIFSPTQAEIWLWGFPLPMVMPNLCLVLTLVVFTSDLNGWLKLSVSAVLIGIATFSWNGLLLWPVIALFMLQRGESKTRVAIWLLVFAAAAGLYFFGYYRVPPAQLVSGSRLDYPAYFLAFVGGALSRGREAHLLLGAILAGTCGVALYILAFVYCLRRSKKTFGNGAPWLALGTYVIGSAALAAYSRVNWGPGQALDSRYVAVSNNLYVALIALAAITTNDAQERRPAFARAIAATRTALITGIVVLTLATFPAGLEEMGGLRGERLVGLAALEFSKVIDTTELMRRALRMIPGFVPAPLEYVATLERLGLLQYRRRGTPILEDSAAHATAKFGRADGFMRRGAVGFEITGWAILPKRSLPAPLVVLAYRAGGHWTAFGHAEVGEYRQDVAATLHSRAYMPSGWRLTLARESLPPEAEEVSAWAVDPLANKVHKLAGEYSLRESSAAGADPRSGKR